MLNIKSDNFSMEIEMAKFANEISNKGIIRVFDKTAPMRSNDDIYCPHFLNFAWGYGCPWNCSWCYLAGTFRYVSYKTPRHRVPPHFKDRKEVAKAVAKFLKLAKHPYILNGGELIDGCCSENMAHPFSKFIMPMFKGTDHKVLFLTKCTWVQNFLENDWQDNAILAWSINSVEVAERYEKLAPSTLERIRAASLVAECGYTVRVRLDPMVPVPGWEEQYSKVIKAMCIAFKPERVTLGTLRGLPSTIGAALDKEWVKYLTENSNWGRKPAIDIRFALYSHAIVELHKFGIRKIGVCKDTRAIWKRLEAEFGMDYHGMACNCIS